MVGDRAGEQVAFMVERDLVGAARGGEHGDDDAHDGHDDDDRDGGDKAQSDTIPIACRNGRVDSRARFRGHLRPLEGEFWGRENR
ncbi:MAG: hypothetical protein BroJett024_30020 [Alphaproteobacteria bacterium]|nr:MAG: hypothetical protein BroJett024_30020 [Alphaproteobacteria bacterium]